MTASKNVPSPLLVGELGISTWDTASGRRSFKALRTVLGQGAVRAPIGTVSEAVDANLAKGDRGLMLLGRLNPLKHWGVPQFCEVTGVVSDSVMVHTDKGTTSAMQMKFTTSDTRTTWGFVQDVFVNHNGFGDNRGAFDEAYLADLGAEAEQRPIQDVYIQKDSSYYVG